MSTTKTLNAVVIPASLIKRAATACKQSHAARQKYVEATDNLLIGIVKAMPADTVKADIKKLIGISYKSAMTRVLKEAGLFEAGFNIRETINKTTGDTNYTNDSTLYGCYVSLKGKLVARGTPYTKSTYIGRRLSQAVTKETSFAEVQKAWLADPDFTAPSSNVEQDRELLTVTDKMPAGEMAKGLSDRASALADMVVRMFCVKLDSEGNPIGYHTIQHTEQMVMEYFSAENVDRILRKVNAS
jgi:hypothetical protein